MKLLAWAYSRANGNNRIDDHEERLKRLEAARREMEDTLVVLAHLESKSAERADEHAQLVSSHEKWMASHKVAM